MLSVLSVYWKKAKYLLLKVTEMMFDNSIQCSLSVKRLLPVGSQEKSFAA